MLISKKPVTVPTQKIKWLENYIDFATPSISDTENNVYRALAIGSPLLHGSDFPNVN